ncbi:ABC transporter ATP-binding protein [Planctomycetota bacterium]
MKTNGAPLIDIRDVFKTYTMGEVEVPVLKGVDLEIRNGEMLTILGESGSGKSTLMNMIGGIDRVDRGAIVFDGEDIGMYNESQLTQYRRDRVGFVFQFYNLVPTLTALENVWAAAEIVDESMDPAEALDLVGLGDRIEHFPAQLSGGQQQRVAIARALAKRPGLLLCDEPTGALDHETSGVILELLRKVNQETGTTLVMITHNPENAHITDRTAVIANGCIQNLPSHETTDSTGEPA